MLPSRSKKDVPLKIVTRDGTKSDGLVEVKENSLVPLGQALLLLFGDSICTVLVVLNIPFYTFNRILTYNVYLFTTLVKYQKSLKK